MALYTVAFLQNDMRNTVLTSPDGQPVYHVETPFKFASRTTTIKRVVPGSAEEVIAVMKFPWAGTDMVDFQGHNVPIRTWLPNSGAFSNSRTIWCEKNNTQYKWKFPMSGTPELQGPDGRVVSSFSPASLGLFSSSGARPASLQIAFPEAEDSDVVDTIVVSFLIVEEERRRRRRQRANANSQMAMNNIGGGNMASIGL